MEREWHGHDVHRANTTQIRTKSTVVLATLPGATDSDLNDCSPYKSLLRVITVIHFTDQESSRRKFSELLKITCKLS